MTKLKKPEEGATEFEANGVKYFIEQSLSFDRYKMYQRLQIECGYDVSFYAMFENLKKLYELQNQGKLADAAVMTHNMISGITNIDKREIPVLTMCTLFINTEDEDRKEITQELVDKKIKDWRQEGIAIEYFFTVAIATMKNFMVAYSEVSQLSSHRSQKKMRKNSDIPNKE